MSSGGHPGLPGYWELKVKQYRQNLQGDVNYGVPRTTSTFWPIVDTNGVVLSFATDSEIIRTNLNAGAAGGWSASEIKIQPGFSSSIVFTVESAVMIRSMEVELEFRSPSVMQNGTISVTLKHDSGAVVPVYTSAQGTLTPDLFLPSPPGQYAKIAFDPDAILVATDLADLSPGLADTSPYDAVAAGNSYQPTGDFGLFTNVVAGGQWTLNLANNLAANRDLYFIGCKITITGDSTSFSTPTMHFKDLNPRSITEGNPYTYVNGAKTYATPRFLADQ